MELLVRMHYFSLLQSTTDIVHFITLKALIELNPVHVSAHTDRYLHLHLLYTQYYSNNKNSIQYCTVYYDILLGVYKSVLQV